MWNLEVGQLAREIDGRLICGMMPPLAGDLEPVGPIRTDSRSVEPGDVFWGLAGARHRGSDYADEAFLRGAGGVVVDRHIEPWAGRWAIRVEDTHWALWRLARVVRDRFPAPVIGVAGSVGKTTCGAMIDTILRQRLAGTVGPCGDLSCGGAPLSLLAWRPDDDYAVLALEARAAGGLGRLAEVSRPRIGVVTQASDGPAVRGRPGAGPTEAELVAALDETSWAVLPGDEPTTRQLTESCRANVVRYGRGGDCDVAASRIECAAGQLSFTALGRRMEVPVWGRHFLGPALAAVATAHLLGFEADEIAAGLAAFEPPAGRCQVHRRDGVTLIDDSEGRHPAAARSGLVLLGELGGAGRRIVVCGDLDTPGGESAGWHYRFGQQAIAVAGADLVLAAGREARHVVAGARVAGAPWEATLVCPPDDLLPVVTECVQPGDVVLLGALAARPVEWVIQGTGSGRRRAA